MNVSDIVRKVNLIYCGVKISDLKPLRNYLEFLYKVLDSEEKHTAALGLHSGFEFYDAAALSLFVIKCLFFNNMSTDNLIKNLEIDDLLFIDGQRVQFLGIKEGTCLGVGFDRYSKYFCYTSKEGKRFVPLEEAEKRNISIYDGESNSLDGKGVKTSLDDRYEFLSIFNDQNVKRNISTKINNSIDIIINKDLAEKLYKNIQIEFLGKRFKLSSLVTAAYYSDNDCYQIGNNPTKEEPIIRFYSKVSSCRDAILDDRLKRTIGVIAMDSNIWCDSSEIHDIADRKSIKYILLQGKSNYLNYRDWFEREQYEYYMIVPEVAASLINDEDTKRETMNFLNEIFMYSRRNIKVEYLKNNVDINELRNIKRTILKLKNETIDSVDKDNFLIGCYFILNLCRSAIFPLSCCDKAMEQSIIGWNIVTKLNGLLPFISSLNGEQKDLANEVFCFLRNMISELYDNNPKGDYIKELVIQNKINCIVIKKAYYETIFKLWLSKYDIVPNDNIKFMTISMYEKSKQGYSNVIFTTSYYDFNYNLFAGFNFNNATLLSYYYEKDKIAQLIKQVNIGKQLIQKNNWFKYDIENEESESKDIVVEETDIENEKLFESELDKIARSLQLSIAKHYLSSSENHSDNMIKIAKIITFASGNVGFFTKHYKGYCLEGDNVVELELENLKVGDSLIFTKESENKDIVDLLLVQLLENQFKNTEYPEYYRLSRCWKDAIRRYMEQNNFSYQDIADKLKVYGCNKNQVTIRAWLYEEVHIVGPRLLEEYDAIVKMTGLSELPERLKEACDKIRRLRTQILGLLGKTILKNVTDSEVDDELWNSILCKAENLSQIEQIVDIGIPDENNKISIYMINKPCNI